MDYKIDLSWLKGEARNVIGKEILKKLCVSCQNFNDFNKIAYLFIFNKEVYFSNKKETFDMYNSTELSVNSVLKGRWKAVSVKKPEAKTAPIKKEFKRGDHVLVKDVSNDIWREAVYSFSEEWFNKIKKFYTVGGQFWNYCIPFDEKLLGKN